MINLNKIPNELRLLNQWVLADMSLNEKGYPKKFPLNPRTGALADVTNPSTWGSFEEVIRTGSQHIGFVLTEDCGYTIIDLDDKEENPASDEEKERFTNIINSFNSYTEVSSSGRGVHIVVKGKIPKGVHRSHVEVYSTGRYMIFTGNVIRNFPIENKQELLDVLYNEMQPVELVDLEQVDGEWTDAEIVERASNASNGNKYNALCSGDMTGYPSQSEADFALMSMIAFYTKDNEQAIRLFKMTALGKREKAQRQSYYIGKYGMLNKIRSNQVPIDFTAFKHNMLANRVNSQMPAAISNFPNVFHSQPLVNIVCADSIIPEPVSWLWNGYLARGKLHIFAGTAGTGKTTLALNLAATISKGGQFADGSECSPSSVLIWSGEDDAKDTLVPRLIASGANLQNIHIISNVTTNNEVRSFDPAIDMNALNLQIKDKKLTNIGLVIVDPIVNAVAGDSHKNGEVRRSLAPLVDFGQETKSAILGISHFSKGTSGRDPLERVTGSLAFGALARIVLVTAKINDGDVTTRIFCRAKSNIGSDVDGFEYDITQVELTGSNTGIFTSYAVFGKAVNGSALELLTELDEETSSELSDCVEFLKFLLKEEGKMPVNDIFNAGANNGYSKDQLKRAKKKLNAIGKREGFGKGSKVVWCLPVINILKNT